MTWPLASLLLVGLVLAAGFAWYERSRPPARVVALVGTMAALAALGRVAFAPLPNVKPTTDIVLICGIALGGAPGFAIGALAALASNVFFGQGPWTPFQMLAWGGVGVAGGMLGQFARDRVGRAGLALAGALAGFGFGFVMNLSSYLTYTDASTGSFAGITVAALPFDVAHAVGNVVFALAFGPALLRMLRRFRARFEVRWRPAAAGVATVAALTLALLAGPALATAASPTTYLLGAQNSDGGWGAARGQGSSQLYTGWTALGLAATGRNPLDVRRGGRSPIDFIRGHAGQLNDTGEIERTILVLHAAGLSPRRFAGRDLVAELARRARPNGAFAGGVVLSAFAELAYRAGGLTASAPGVRRTRAWIASQQNPDGGFNTFGRGGPSGVDDTASAIEGLAAAGAGGSRTVSRAVGFLRRVQNPDGGYPLIPGDRSNAQSTAYVVQGFVAAGRDPGAVRRAGSRSPLQLLRTLIAPDGSVRYSRTGAQTPVWVTAQALAALQRRALPIAAAPRSTAGRATAGAAASAKPGAATKPGSRTAAATGASPVPLAILALARQAGLAAAWVLTPLT
jgi:energy-coupling factor transport system substrate-specific component